MLTKIFSTNSFFTIALFIVMTLVLWLRVITNSVAMIAPVPTSPLYHLMFKLLSNLPVVCGFISIALLFLQAWLINYILVENDLIPRKSYIAAFILVIFLSLFNEAIVLNPVLIAEIFIISTLRLILRLFEEHEAYSTVLNAGTLISLASMFYFPAIIFLLVIWAAFIIYRLFTWREWFISVLGFIVPYLFLASYYFWNDCLSAKLLMYKNTFGFINFHNFAPSTYIYIVLAFLGLLMLASIFKLLSTINEKQIRIRKVISLLIWYLIFSFGSLCLSAGYGIAGFLMMLLPAAVLFSLYISNLKKSLIGELHLLP